MTRLKQVLMLSLAMLMFSGCGKTDVVSDMMSSLDITEVTLSPLPSQSPTPMPKSPAEDIVLYWRVSDGMSSPENMVPLVDAVENYVSSSIAAEDGCVVNSLNTGCIVSGQDIWDSFVETSLAGNPCKMRIVVTYLREIDPVTKQHYDEPVEDIGITDVEFTGDVYVKTFYRDPTGSGEKQLSYQIIRPLKDEELNDDGDPNDMLFTNYGGDAELAINDGCIVISTENNAGIGDPTTECVSGAERFYTFLDKSYSEKYDAVRIVQCDKDAEGKIVADRTIDVICDDGYYYLRYFELVDGVWCEYIEVFEHLVVLEAEGYKDTYALIYTKDYIVDTWGYPINENARRVEDEILPHWRLFAQ